MTTSRRGSGSTSEKGGTDEHHTREVTSMTITHSDIDLTAAKNAAREALETNTTWSPMHCVDVIVDAALPHILAQVEARVTPSRDDIVQALINSDIIASDTRANAQIVGHNDREPFLCFADDVLALIPGRTEQEVWAEARARAEVRECRGNPPTG